MVSNTIARKGLRVQVPPRAQRANRLSDLGPTNLIEQCNAATSGDRDGEGVHPPPLDAEPIAGFAEQLLDVLRSVRELVAPISVRHAIASRELCSGCDNHRCGGVRGETDSGHSSRTIRSCHRWRTIGRLMLEVPPRVGGTGMAGAASSTQSGSLRVCCDTHRPCNSATRGGSPKRTPRRCSGTPRNRRLRAGRLDRDGCARCGRPQGTDRVGRRYGSCGGSLARRQPDGSLHSPLRPRELNTSLSPAFNHRLICVTDTPVAAEMAIWVNPRVLRRNTSRTSASGRILRG